MPPKILPDCPPIHFIRRSGLSIAALVSLCFSTTGVALDNDNYQMATYNGWDGFEVISSGDDPADDGVSYAMPAIFDGIGAQVVGANLRIQVNHEIGSGNAGISQVMIGLAGLKTAIDHVMTNGGGDTGGATFVVSAQQAYNRWSGDAGASWTATSNASTTSFSRFCSGQSYEPNTFGAGRGFVDHVYMTGEEVGAGRLFALDIVNGDLYQVSGVAGSGGSGLGGMPFDAYENAALLDTGETGHVALLLSPDGGTTQMKIYIGEKGKDVSGNPATDFLSRNGLAYGSYYYLNATLPASAGDTDSGGYFDTTSADALSATKLEDVDTSPAFPNRAVLGNQNFGVFTLNFVLDFSGGGFDAGLSSFSITKVANQLNALNTLGNADNVDWTMATTLDGVTHSEGLIFVNEDNSSGEVWMMNPDGTGLTLIASTLQSTESTGILDISLLLGYNAGSIILTNDQSSTMTVLINPDATLAPNPVTEYFVYDPVGGVAEFECSGGYGAYYKIIKDGDLDWSDAVPVIAGSATIGTIRGDYLVADKEGQLRAQVDLGTALRMFLRLESP